MGLFENASRPVKNDHVERVLTFSLLLPERERGRKIPGEKRVFFSKKTELPSKKYKNKKYVLSPMLSGVFVASCFRPSRTVPRMLDALVRHVQCWSFDYLTTSFIPVGLRSTTTTDGTVVYSFFFLLQELRLRKQTRTCCLSVIASRSDTHPSHPQPSLLRLSITRTPLFMYSP